MIRVEDAVQSAVRALPGFLGGRSPDGIRVEEVVPPEGDAGEWQITLSYLEPGVERPEHPVFKSIVRRAPEPERVLRVITVRADSGRARAMVLRPTG